MIDIAVWQRVSINDHRLNSLYIFWICFWNRWFSFLIIYIIGMKNTAIVFLILFLLERYTETHFDNDWNPWFYFFILSILLWRAALYLHANP